MFENQFWDFFNKFGVRHKLLVSDLKVEPYHSLKEKENLVLACEIMELDSSELRYVNG